MKLHSSALFAALLGSASALSSNANKGLLSNGEGKLPEVYWNYLD